MSKKQVIRLTEQDLHRIIKESVNEILNEAIRFKKGEKMAKHAALNDINAEREKNSMGMPKDGREFYRHIAWNDLDKVPEEGEDLLYIDY